MLTAVWGATDGQRMNDEWAALRDKSGKEMEMSVNLDGLAQCVHRAEDADGLTYFPLRVP